MAGEPAVTVGVVHRCDDIGAARAVTVCGFTEEALPGFDAVLATGKHPGEYGGGRTACGICYPPLAVDERQWVPIPSPVPAVGMPRSWASYAAVLDALPLLDSPRYQPRAGLTFCNIYVWDATLLLGCEIPHWVEDKDGRRALIGHGREQTANDMADWLQDHGSKHGWGPCGPATAQLMASRGNPTVAVWRNPGGTGHIAMVRPGELHPEKGPCVAQAGKRNFRNGHVLDGFGAGRPVEYYVHLPAAQKPETSSK